MIVWGKRNRVSSHHVCHQTAINTRNPVSYLGLSAIDEVGEQKPGFFTQYLRHFISWLRTVLVTSVEHYIKEFLTNSENLGNDDSRIDLIFDDARMRYMAVWVGWHQCKRIHECAIHDAPTSTRYYEKPGV